MKFIIKITVMALLILMQPAISYSKIKIVTSTSDLSYYVQKIGKDFVEVKSIASPKSDIHFIETRPSFIIKVSQADIVFKIGMDLDLWMDKLIEGSRNSKLKIFDCSKYIHRMEVPSQPKDARYGDIHQSGNPHYWLSPDNLKPITDLIVKGLSDVNPENSDFFKTNQNEFLSSVDSSLIILKPLISKISGYSIVFYHNTWPYFNNYFGLKAAGFIEPFPGVPPSPSHIKNIISLIRHQNVKIIAIEPYFEKSIPGKIATATGAKIITLYPSIGGINKDETYIDWLKSNLDFIKEALDE